MVRHGAHNHHHNLGHALSNFGHAVKHLFNNMGQHHRQMQQAQRSVAPTPAAPKAPVARHRVVPKAPVAPKAPVVRHKVVPKAPVRHKAASKAPVVRHKATSKAPGARHKPALKLPGARHKAAQAPLNLVPASKAPVAKHKPAPKAPVAKHKPAPKAPVAKHKTVPKAPAAKHKPVSKAPVAKHKTVPKAPAAKHKPASKAPAQSAPTVPQLGVPAPSNQNGRHKYAQRNYGHRVYDDVMMAIPAIPVAVAAVQTIHGYFSGSAHGAAQPVSDVVGSEPASEAVVPEDVRNMTLDQAKAAVLQSREDLKDPYTTKAMYEQSVKNLCAQLGRNIAGSQNAGTHAQEMRAFMKDDVVCGNITQEGWAYIYTALSPPPV